MPVIIPDEILEQAGLTAHSALIEFACHLFDEGKLTLPAASRLAGISGDEFQAELQLRNIAVFRPSVQDIRDDLDALNTLGNIAP